MYSSYYCVEQPPIAQLVDRETSLLVKSDISRSLVQIRVGGMWYFS